MQAQNPFTLLFGKVPAEQIEQLTQKQEILDTFTSDYANQQIYAITGVRGSGKTVLMSSVANRLRNDDDWIVVELNPEADLLQTLAAKLSADNRLSDWFRRAKINLSLLGLGVEISGTAPIADYETAVSRMLEAIRRRDKRVLILIDEVTNTPQMRIFAASFQIFVRQDLPVFLLMTGLYENIDSLQNEKSLTFLYRAPKIRTEPLNMGAIKLRYQSLFGLNDEDAVEMAKLTRGYPFAFQVLGYLTFRENGDFRSVISSYRQYLEDYVYSKIWAEMSPKDRVVASGVLRAESHEVSDVMHILGMTRDQFNPYRKRLIDKGIVSGRERGKLTFSLPFFDAFVKDRLDMDWF